VLQAQLSVSPDAGASLAPEDLDIHRRTQPTEQTNFYLIVRRHTLRDAFWTASLAVVSESFNGIQRV